MAKLPWYCKNVKEKYNKETKEIILIFTVSKLFIFLQYFNLKMWRKVIWQ